VTSLLAIYQDIEDLVNIGAYVPGVNAEYDLAVQCRPRIVQFLQQEPQNPSAMEQTKKQLMELDQFVGLKEKEIALRAQGTKPAPRGAAPVAASR
jgi:hypothetical protein